jgi:hypothetical protein
MVLVELTGLRIPGLGDLTLPVPKLVEGDEVVVTGYPFLGLQFLSVPWIGPPPSDLFDAANATELARFATYTIDPEDPVATVVLDLSAPVRVTLAWKGPGPVLHVGRPGQAPLLSVPLHGSAEV